MSNDLISRLRSVIIANTDERRRLKHLEEETGIPDRNWKQVWSRRQRPTAQMIEAIARRWPEYAFWMVTGMTDRANGHLSAGWVRHPNIESEEDPYAKDYFELKRYIEEKLYSEGNVLLRNADGSAPKKYANLDEAIADIARAKWMRAMAEKFSDPEPEPEGDFYLEDFKDKLLEIKTRMTAPHLALEECQRVEGRVDSFKVLYQKLDELAALRKAGK